VTKLSPDVPRLLGLEGIVHERAALAYLPGNPCIAASVSLTG